MKARMFSAYVAVVMVALALAPVAEAGYGRP